MAVHSQGTDTLFH